MASRSRAGPSRPTVPRPVAAGGWRRAVAGALVGLSAGALLGVVLPRGEDGDGRRRPPARR